MLSIGQVNIERLPNNMSNYDTLPPAVKDRILYTHPPAYDADRNMKLYYKNTGRFPFWKGRTKVRFQNKIYYCLWNANRYGEPWVFYRDKLYLIERNGPTLEQEIRDGAAAERLTIRVFQLKPVK